MMAGRRNHTAPNNGSIRSAVAIPLAFYSRGQYFAPKLLMRRPEIAGFTPVIKTCGAGKLRQYSHHKFGKIWRGKICPVLAMLRRRWLRKVSIDHEVSSSSCKVKWLKSHEIETKKWISRDINLQRKPWNVFHFWQRQNSQKFLRLGTWLDICQSLGLQSH